jgi:hypothetical protein
MNTKATRMVSPVKKVQVLNCKGQVLESQSSAGGVRPLHKKVAHTGFMKLHYTTCRLELQVCIIAIACANLDKAESSLKGTTLSERVGIS